MMHTANRRGAILVFVAVSTVMLIGILVLTIDAGTLQQHKRMAQTAADAGAIAGAIEIFRNRVDSVEESAMSETKRNGFEHSVNGAVVTVTYPSTNAPYNGDKYVTVNVRRTLPTSFAKIFGMGTSVIRTQATAGLTVAEYCFLVLDQTGGNALQLENSAHLTGSGCGAQVNSTSATGANVSGTQAQITVPFIGVGGSGAGGVSKISPTPEYNVPPTPDPMSQLAMPTVPNTCDYGSPAARATFSGTITLNPGTYCGGMDVNGDITFNQGLYIFRGGGLRVVGGGASLRSTGTGTTFLNTAAPAGASYGWEPIWVQSGSVTINIYANTDPASALPGVLFYTDPAAPYMENLFKANSVSRMDGTMYFPTGLVNFESGASFTINGSLIAYRVRIAQSANLTFTGYGGGAQWQSLRRATVVE